jgi:plasmid stabilization system protein ParE
MALTIYWSKRADKKFDKIIAYLEQEWGEAVTQAFVRKVYDFLDILLEFPELGSFENAERNIRGFVIVKQLTIFYKITEDRIIILNFFDNRQNPIRKKY